MSNGVVIYGTWMSPEARAKALAELLQIAAACSGSDTEGERG